MIGHGHGHGHSASSAGGAGSIPLPAGARQYLAEDFDDTGKVFPDASSNGLDLDTLVFGTAVKGSDASGAFVTCTGLYIEASGTMPAHPMFIYMVAKMNTVNSGMVGSKESTSNHVSFLYSNSSKQLACNIGDGSSNQAHNRIDAVDYSGMTTLHELNVTTGSISLLANGEYAQTQAEGVVVLTKNSKTTNFTPTIGRNTGKLFTGEFRELIISNERLSVETLAAKKNEWNDKYGSSITISTDQVTERDIMLIGAQSNGEGRAANANLPVANQGPQTNVDIISPAGVVAALEEGVNNLAGVAQHGPEMYMGFDLNAITGRKVIIGKHGVGSTQLTDNGAATWSMLTTASNPASTLIGAAMTIYDNLRWYCWKNNINFKIVSYLFAQGERDANSAVMATKAGYKAELIAFISGIRKELGEPNLPFIDYQIHIDLVGNPTYPNAQQIRDAKTEVSNEDANVFLSRPEFERGTPEVSTLLPYAAAAFTVDDLLEFTDETVYNTLTTNVLTGTPATDITNLDVEDALLATFDGVHLETKAQGYLGGDAANNSIQ